MKSLHTLNDSMAFSKWIKRIAEVGEDFLAGGDIR
ncbi:MAG: hypothetical protein IKT81_04225 [Clostridia bacterium]|nr:hypothetical protein [Clostridia bacterium]MBR4955528.1 hypothetical protein [Clostridia bacterium]MBR5903235.1 hypothetical protein [Clostridia bacterium]